MRVGLKKATETVIVLLAPALLTALMVVAAMLMIGIAAPEWAVAWESFTAPLRALFRVLT